MFLFSPFPCSCSLPIFLIRAFNFSSMASPNLSATSASASAAASSSVESGARQITDIRAPLWDHVTILEKPKPGGGKILWRCNYCPFSKSTSYTRILTVIDL